MTTQRETKHARDFNKSSVEMSKKQKQKHKQPKHKKADHE